MLMRYKIFTLGLCSILSVNLSAASYETSVASADCKDRYCLYESVGIGGAYYNLNASDVLSQAYYLYIGAKYVWSARAQFGFDVRIGAGKNNLKGTFPTTLKTNAGYFYYDAKLKGGFNVLSKDNPLFINIFGSMVSQTPSNSFGRAYSLLGVELDGNVAIGENLKLTYGAGYGWLYARYWYGNDTSAKIENSLKNFEVNTSMGISYEFGGGYAYFARIIGRYQNIGASSEATYENALVSYPKSSNYAGMLEMGVEF